MVLRDSEMQISDERNPCHASAVRGVRIIGVSDVYVCLLIGVMFLMFLPFISRRYASLSSLARQASA